MTRALATRMIVLERCIIVVDDGKEEQGEYVCAAACSLSALLILESSADQYHFIHIDVLYNQPRG
jgi:hypothetical protein